MHCKVLSRRFWILGSSLAWCITSPLFRQFSALPAVWKCQHVFCFVHLHTNAIILIFAQLVSSRDHDPTSAVGIRNLHDYFKYSMSPKPPTQIVPTGARLTLTKSCSSVSGRIGAGEYYKGI